MLSTDVAISTMIWTCFADGAPSALENVLDPVKDVDWLHNIPEHIVPRRSKLSGSGSQAGRNWSQKGGLNPWPPACAMIYAAGASTSSRSNKLLKVLAKWIKRSPKAADFSEQLWKAGGFLIPSFCRRLHKTGAPIDCRMWRDQWTALQIAATLREHDLIPKLLEFGADPTLCSPNGYTALHWMASPEEPFNMEEAAGMLSSSQLGDRMMGQSSYHEPRIAASIKALARKSRSQKYTG